MNPLLLFYLTFLSTFIHGIIVSQIVISGSAPNHKNETVTLNKYTDYFTYNYDVLNIQEIDSLGNFQFNLKVEKSFLAIIKIENKYGYIYIDPEAISYQLYFPSSKNEGNDLLSNIPIQLVFNDLPRNDLNTQILDFNLRLDYFLYGDTTRLIRMAKHEKEFKDSLNNFKEKLIPLYQSIKKEYLHNYIRYSIASIEQLSLYSNKEKNRLNTYNFFLKDLPVLYQNDAYMIFFNQFYENLLLIPEVGNEEKIKFAINSYNSLEKLNEALSNDYYLKDPKIRELAIIKGLGSIFHNKYYNASNIISILNEIKTNSIFPEHKKIAENMILTLTNLLPGFEAPTLSLLDQNKEELSIGKFKDKYIYLNFFSTNNSQSLIEMDLIYELKKKYDNNIAYVSVCLDKKETDYLNYLKNNPSMDWHICHYNNDLKIISDYKIRSLPKYILINPDGTINQAPAYSPNPNGTFKSIEDTFFNIHKADTKKKNFRIGEKN